MVRYLLSNDANMAPKHNGASPLFIACERGHGAIAELLIQAGMPHQPRRKDKITPLYMACQNSKINCVKALLEHGVTQDPRYDNDTPINMAAYESQPEIVELLLDYGATMKPDDKWGFTPLHSACSKHSEECIRHLLRHGADPTIRDKVTLL